MTKKHGHRRGGGAASKQPHPHPQPQPQQQPPTTTTTAPPPAVVASTRSTNGREPTRGGGKKQPRGGKQAVWKDPTPAEIAQSIRESRLQLKVALVVDAAMLDGDLEQTLQNVREWCADNKYDVTGQAVAGDTTALQLPLLECGVSEWDDLVEMQRLVDSLERPTATTFVGEVEESLACHAALRARREVGAELVYALEMNGEAIDSLHKFTSGLRLRVQSLGLPVRSLLGELVAVPLIRAMSLNTISRPASPSERFEWRGQQPWHQLALVASSDSSTCLVQRVFLPPRARLVPGTALTTSLRNPQLVGIVDRLLKQYGNSRQVQVIIVRGIPGSGKSSLGREILAICRARGAKSVVCSADTHFETKRGYEFNVKGLSKAHEACHQRFQRALTGGKIPIIVVDNTHTQRWEYQTYVDAAVQHNCGLHILEMRCPDVLTCIRMAQRNSHGVSVAKVMAMHQRWEDDARATAFTPQFELPLLWANPVTRNKFNNYVAYVGVFLDTPSRQRLLERVHPRHQNVLTEHVTMYYRPTSQYIRQVPIGARFKIHFDHQVHDDRGQSLPVTLDERLHLKSRNKVPHITVSTEEGVSAFYSNELLSDATATRSEVGKIEVDGTLGVVLMAQGRKVITLHSPFDYQYDFKVGTTSHEVDELVILHVSDEELINSFRQTKRATSNCDTEARMLRQLLTRHHFGPIRSTRRILCVQQPHGSSHSLPNHEVGVALSSILVPSAAPALSQLVNSIVFRQGNAGLQELIHRELQNHVIKRVTVLSSSDIATLPTCTNLDRDDVRISFKHFDATGKASEVFASVAPSPGASLTRSLDSLGLPITEEATHFVFLAIKTVEMAWLSSAGVSCQVTRIDSSGIAQPASVVDLSLTVCEDVGMGGKKRVHALIQALEGHGVHSIEVMNSNQDEFTIYLQLPTRSPTTPVFRLALVSPTESTKSAKRLQDVQESRRIVRDELRGDQQEMHSRLVPLLSRILTSRCLPLSSATEYAARLHLLSESALLAFIQYRGSSTHTDDDTEEARVTDQYALWMCFVDCLRFLAAWSTDEWAKNLSLVSSLVGEDHESLSIMASVTARLNTSLQDCVAIVDDAIVDQVDERNCEGSSVNYLALVQGLVTPTTHARDNWATMAKHSCPAPQHAHPDSSHGAIRACIWSSALTQTALRVDINPHREAFFSAPSELLRGHVDIVASSQELIDRVLAVARESLTSSTVAPSATRQSTDTA